MVRHRTRNAGIVGSNPTGGSKTLILFDFLFEVVDDYVNNKPSEKKKLNKIMIYCKIYN